MEPTEQLISSPDERIVALTRSILASRFPAGTQSERFRQLAFVHLAYAEALRGHLPTRANLAQLLGATPSETDAITRTLRDRGVVLIGQGAGQRGAPSEAYIFIRPDAVAALSQSHLSATGEELAIDPTI